MAPIDHEDGTGVYCNYGWPTDELPDFSTIEAGQPLAPERPKANAKTQSATLAIVGVLLQFIKGELGTQPHPEYESEAKLIGLLVDQRGHYHGIGERNLIDKFAAAKRQLKDA